MSREFGWDLPPGCSESDIPGNRPQDKGWEEMTERLAASGLDAEEILRRVFSKIWGGKK